MVVWSSIVVTVPGMSIVPSEMTSSGIGVVAWPAHHGRVPGLRNGYVVHVFPMMASGWQHSISHEAIQIGSFMPGDPIRPAVAVLIDSFI